MVQIKLQLKADLQGNKNEAIPFINTMLSTDGAQNHNDIICRENEIGVKTIPFIHQGASLPCQWLD